MKQYCYVIINNAGHSWPALINSDVDAGGDPNTSILAQLLKEGWEPVRETPMGGGTSQLAHSLILLENTVAKAKPGRVAKR
jgi:hypothetical protein